MPSVSQTVWPRVTCGSTVAASGLIPTLMETTMVCKNHQLLFGPLGHDCTAGHHSRVLRYYIYIFFPLYHQLFFGGNAKQTPFV